MAGDEIQCGGQEVYTVFLHDMIGVRNNDGE